MFPCSNPGVSLYFFFPPRAPSPFTSPRQSTPPPFDQPVQENILVSQSLAGVLSPQYPRSSQGWWLPTPSLFFLFPPNPFPHASIQCKRIRSFFPPLTSRSRIPYLVLIVMPRVGLMSRHFWFFSLPLAHSGIFEVRRKNMNLGLPRWNYGGYPPPWGVDRNSQVVGIRRVVHQIN